VSLSLSLEADNARHRTQDLFQRLLAIMSCCTEWFAASAAESGWTSWDALPAADHEHSAAVSSTPRLHPAAVTRWRTTPSTGCCDRPTQRSSSTPRPEVAVQRGDMHVPGGHREQRRQRTKRGCSEQRRRRQPLQQVASSVCSLSVSSTSVRQKCSTYLHAVDDVRLGEEDHTRARHT